MTKLGKVGQAFFGRFHSLREVQRQSFSPIMAGRNVLVSSATASGKTEAIFAPLVSRIRSLTQGTRQSIRILAVAPTRALVNDLHARLERPLLELGLACGRQTSDHREKKKKPDVLITTPESFDSMLVRDGTRKKGTLDDHILAGVAAVLIDEAHLFDASPRGDHVAWLLGRLRRLRAYARIQGWAQDGGVQVCGASATLASPHILAEKLLGKDSMVILVEGNREMEIFADRGSTRWVSFDQLKGLEDIYSLIHTVSGKSDLHSMVRLIWNAIEKGKEDGNRKVLVFVPSRALCDKLSLVLSDEIKKRRDLFVGAHHGSLERALREKAEQKFMTSRDAILVATTTLEVGIDIGDVDVVALVGAPPNTSSLLQRIGRSGRRNGVVRVLPIASNRIEARAFSSMLDAAFRGALDPTPSARLWSVFVQQAASHTAQAGTGGRLRDDLLHLAQEVWPEAVGPKTASRILDFLVEQEMLEEKRDRLYLGSIWSDRFERSGGDLHHNFESGDAGIPVIDASTGEVLAHVAQTAIGPKGIALAGQRWDIVSDSGEIILKSYRAEEGGKTFRYAARSAPTTLSFAEHVRRGLGFEDNETPIVDLGGRTLWFHFAGSAYESVLKSLFPDLKSVRELNGLAVRESVSEKNLKTLTANRPSLMANLQKAADGLVSSLSLGRFHSDLPQDVRTSVAVEFFGPDKFFEWLSSRKVTLLNEKDEKYRKLIHDLME